MVKVLHVPRGRHKARIRAVFFRAAKKARPATRSRTSNENGRIVITGTGRAGTTFLVQLFTALGFNTGLSVDEAINLVDTISRGGLEVNDVTSSSPYVIKSPWFVDNVLPSMQARGLKICIAIVPMRDLYAAAESRRRVTDAALRAGGDPAVHHPGGLWLTDDPLQQENKLALQYYELTFSLTRSEIPTVVLEFPRFAHDHQYLFAKLQSLLNDHGVGLEEFRTAFERTAQPSSIHEFYIT